MQDNFIQAAALKQRDDLMESMKDYLPPPVQLPVQPQPPMKADVDPLQTQADWAALQKPVQTNSILVQLMPEESTVIQRKELAKGDVLQSYCPAGIIKTLKVLKRLTHNAIPHLRSYKDREEYQFSRKQTFEDPATVRFEEDIDIEDQLLIEPWAVQKLPALKLQKATSHNQFEKGPIPFAQLS